MCHHCNISIMQHNTMHAQISLIPSLLSPVNLRTSQLSYFAQPELINVSLWSQINMMTIFLSEPIALVGSSEHITPSTQP